MRMKSVLFGFGLGMVFVSAIFLLAYRHENQQADLQYDDRAIERASQLGMVWPAEEVTEIVRKALELGMSFDDYERAMEQLQRVLDYDEE